MPGQISEQKGITAEGCSYASGGHPGKLPPFLSHPGGLQLRAKNAWRETGETAEDYLYYERKHTVNVQRVHFKSTTKRTSTGTAVSL